MSDTRRGITILNVRHASRVAAIPTAAGPARLLEAGLAEAVAATGLRVRVSEVPAPRADAPGEVAESFAVADSIARRVRETLADDRLVLVLSGSCHTAIGSVSGIADRPRGVVWLDGHGDFNTPETSESGLLDGTTLASITGRCWKRLSASVAGFAPVPDDHVVLMGARNLDPGEAELFEASGITRISTQEASTKAADVLRSLGRRIRGGYVHLDLDVLDRSAGIANAYATEGGFTTDELEAVLETVMACCPVRVVAFASYDPSTDEAGTVCEAAVRIGRAIAEGARSG